MTKKARTQELLNKLKTGWNVLCNRIGYYDYRIEITLVSTVSIIGSMLLFYLLPWYIFAILLKVEYVNMLLPFFFIFGIISGIFFYLLTLNYAWVNGWFQ